MYKVGWAKSAQDELANMWTEADSTLRGAITAATGQIDVLLKNAPMDVGESRTPNRRIAFVHPIGLAFSVVDESNRRAKVLHVWLY
jgi:hypothetical protein